MVSSRTIRYRTNEAFRLKTRARSYAKQLKAGVIHNPSAYLVRRYQLEALVAELGLEPVERREREHEASLDSYMRMSPEQDSLEYIPVTLQRFAVNVVYANQGFARTSSPDPSESRSQEAA